MTPVTQLRGGEFPPDPYDLTQPGEDELAAPALQRVKLGNLMNSKSVTRPPVLLGDLIYPATLHTLAGPPGAGKTVMALWFAAEVMRRGSNVLLCDEETTPRQAATLLAALGVEPDLVDAHLHYLPSPGLPWNRPRLIDAMGDYLDEHKPVLTIWDSFEAILAMANIDSTRDGGAVTRFWKQVFKPIAVDHNAAVLVLDHVGKNDDPESRHAIGTQSKLAGFDVTMKLRAVRRFSHHQDGLLRLTVTKDRDAWLHENWEIRVTRDPLRLEFTPSTAAAAETKLSPAAEKIMSVLSANPVTIPVLIDRVAAKYRHGLKRETVQRELGGLRQTGMAAKHDMGAGRPALWSTSGGTLDDAVPPPDGPPQDGWGDGTVGDEAQQ